MQMYDKNSEIIKAMVGTDKEVTDRAFQALNNGTAQKVVIARLEVGLLFYVKGLKFEIKEINDDEMTIKAVLYTGPKKPGDQSNK